MIVYRCVMYDMCLLLTLLGNAPVKFDCEFFFFGNFSPGRQQTQKKTESNSYLLDGHIIEIWCAFSKQHMSEC